MIMTLQAGDKLMSLADVSEMLGIPVHTLYRWRYKGDGPTGYRVGRHVRYRREAVEAWLEQQVDQRSQARRRQIGPRAADKALNQELTPSGPEGIKSISAAPVACLAAHADVSGRVGV
jgi:excisionase family DNA binding protein